MAEEEPIKDNEIKRSKFERILFEKFPNLTLKDIHDITGVAYPTLINLKKGRRLNYRQRTLRDVSMYLGVAPSDLLEDDDEISYNTPFEKIMKEKGLTLQDIHEKTGVAYPILMDLKKGRPGNYRKRTIRDVAEYLEMEESLLIPASSSDNKFEKAAKE